MTHKRFYWDGNLDAMYEAVFDACEYKKVKVVDDEGGIIKIKKGAYSGEIVVGTREINVDVRSSTGIKALCCIMLCFVWGLIPLYIVYSLLSGTPQKIIREVFKEVALGAGNDYEINIPWRLPARRNVRPPPRRSTQTFEPPSTSPLRRSPEVFNPPSSSRAPPIEQRRPQVGGVKCPNCGVGCPPDMTFCTNCGRYLLA